MGMFDTIRAKRDGQDIEVQVKVFMGRYEPGCAFYEMGTPIPDPDFPKIRFAEWGYADDGDCIVEFDEGRAVRIVWPPIPKGYQFPDLPKPRRHPGRKMVAVTEEQKRIGERFKGMTPKEAIAKVFSEHIVDMISRPGLSRMIFTEGNYAKIGGKWQRIRPV